MTVLQFHKVQIFELQGIEANALLAAVLRGRGVGQTLFGVTEFVSELVLKFLQ